MRCLIVDDNSEFLHSAVTLLEGQGFEVVGVAMTGAEGLERAAQLRPDVILVDAFLGEESGLDVVRQLVAEDRTAGSAIILISSYSEPDFAECTEASGVAGFLRKAELSVRAIRSLLGAG